MLPIILDEHAPPGRVCVITHEALAQVVVSAAEAMTADLREMAEGRYTGRHSQAWLDGKAR
jgi:hypothetical protein